MIDWWWLIPAFLAGAFAMIFLGALVISGDADYDEGYFDGFSDALSKLDDRMEQR